MKEFFEDLGKFITETAGNVGKKDGRGYGSTEAEKPDPQSGAQQSGRSDRSWKDHYERFRKEEAVDGELEVICEEIRKRRMIIVAFEKKLADMKGVKECENCQELIEKDMKFCPHCGAEVKKEEMPQECEDIFAESDVSESAKMEETTEEVIEDIMEKAADVTKVSVEHVKDAASEIAEDVRESVHEVKEHIKESVEDIRE